MVAEASVTSAATRVGWSLRGSALGLRGTKASFCRTAGATPGQVPPRAAGVVKPSHDAAGTSPAAGAVGMDPTLVAGYLVL